jgi:hypothetical protein
LRPKSSGTGLTEPLQVIEKQTAVPAKPHELVEISQIRAEGDRQPHSIILKHQHVVFCSALPFEKDLLESSAGV